MRVNTRSGVSMAVVAIILVAIVVAAAAAAYFASRPSSSGTASSSTTTVGQLTTTASSPESVTGATETTSTTATGTSTAASLATCTEAETQTGTTSTNQMTADFDFIEEFSAISFGLNITTHSTTNHEVFSYLAAPSSRGITEVNISVSEAFNSTSQLVTHTIWANIDNMSIINATDYVTSHGKTYSLGTQTGFAAETMFTEDMAELTAYDTTYGIEYYSYYTNPLYFHSTGTMPMTFGPTTFDVTTYVPNNTPELFNACGVAYTLQEWTLELGTPPGTSSIFVTYIHSVGSDVVDGVTESNDFTLALTSVTLA